MGMALRRADLEIAVFRKRFWYETKMARICAVLLIAISRSARSQSFLPGANFTTMTFTQSTGEPPDTMGAAGPNHFVAFNNDGFSIYRKDGAPVSSVSPASFWTSALGSNPGGLTDPRILYDPASQRWFAVMITTDQSSNNKILFARSNTSDPTQGFKGVSFTTTNGLFADFPTLGLDANGVYVGTNNFNGNFLDSEALYSVPKVDLLATNPTLSRLTKFDSLNSSTYGDSLQPVVDYGAKLATDPEIIAAKVATTSVEFSQLTGTAAAGATLSSPTTKTVTSTSAPSKSRQQGSSNRIDNGEDNFSSNAVRAGNYLYVVNSTNISNRTAVRWTIADATTFNIVQQGTISSSSLSYFYPSIAVNAVGDVVVGFSASSSSTHVSTYAVVGISAGGVPGGSLSFGSPVSPVLTQAGLDYYDGSRWGDYSATTLDPADPGIFWTHQEYAAARQFSGTNWNWATQATEIIPLKAGERRWSNVAGGSFTAGGNYFTGAAPVASDHVIFSRPSASYTVTFSGTNASNRASVRQGNVNWNLGGGSYTLSNNSPATPSLVVGDFQGTAALFISGGTVNTVNAAIGGSGPGTAALTLNANTTLTNSNSLTVGSNGPGTLNVQSLGTVYAGTNLSIGASGTVNLNGGTIRIDGYSRSASGTIGYTLGTVQLSGNRTIDSDLTVKDWFGTSPTIGASKKLAIEGNATLASSAPLILAGGTLTGASFQISSGGHLNSTQSSQVLAPVAALAGSVIDASSGDLSMGDTTRTDGFYGNGTLGIGSHTVTLADSDAAVLDASATTTLGAGANSGTIAVANGLTLNSGGQISGYGSISTPDDVAKPFTNMGSVTGTSLAQAVALPGYVKGTGSFNNVEFDGTYSPGLSTASITLGSAKYAGTLGMEIGGRTAGSEYDQLNHTQGSGVAQLGGTLAVSLLSGFQPQAGDVFDILTATGGVSGTFATTMLPALTGDLFWNINYGANLVELQVESPTPVLQGDFNGDGTVDAADYVTWRVGFENNTYTMANYNVWRDHFGETLNNASSALASSSPVPEPAAILLAACCVVIQIVRRRPARVK